MGNDREPYPISAAGLDLVEYHCTACGLRWWIEKSMVGLQEQCNHPKESQQRTGYDTHIRMVDF